MVHGTRSSWGPEQTSAGKQRAVERWREGAADESEWVVQHVFQRAVVGESVIFVMFLWFSR